MKCPDDQDFRADEGVEEPLTTGGILVFLLLIALLTLAPLVDSERSAIALIQLELLAVLSLVITLWTPRRLSLSRLETVAVTLVLLGPLCYLLPLPDSLAELLPGREPYDTTLMLLPQAAERSQTIVSGDTPDTLIDAIAQFFRIDTEHLSAEARSLTESLSQWLSPREDSAGEQGGATASIVPQKTFAAWLFLLPLLAVFLGVRTSGCPQIRTLVMLVLVVSAAETVLGTAQFATGQAWLLKPDTDVSAALGTYRDPNHLAGLIAMATPTVMALFALSLASRAAGGPGERWRDGASPVRAGNLRTFGLGVVLVALVLGMILSRSRAGIFLLIVGILLCTLIFMRRVQNPESPSTQPKVLAIVVGLSAAVGLMAVLEQFSVPHPIADIRWSLWTSTTQGIQAFFPAGSGPGTYADVIPIFLQPETGHRAPAHAHNGYLEWLFEAGALAAVLMALWLWLFTRQWIRLFRAEDWSDFQFIQAGSGIGLLLLLMCELVDQNLHIQANAIYFAFFAGVFFHGIQRKKSSQTLDDSQQEIDDWPLPLRTIPPDKAKNPFLD